MVHQKSVIINTNLRTVCPSFIQTLTEPLSAAAARQLRVPFSYSVARISKRNVMPFNLCAKSDPLVSCKIVLVLLLGGIILLLLLGCIMLLR